MTPFEYGAAQVKQATVHPLVKQFRRVLTAVQQGTHDFHGGDAMSILRDGVIHPGTTNVLGEGAYFARKAPEMGYFVRNGYRGIIAPTPNVSAQGAHAVGTGRSGLAYIKAPKGYKVQPGDLAVHTHLPGDRAVMQEAQRALKVRPIEAPAFYGADLVAKGRSVPSVESDLKNKATMNGFRSWLGSETT